MYSERSVIAVFNAYIVPWLLILVNSYKFSSMAQELLLINWEIFSQG